MPTIDDVAKKAKVAKSTVSYVLNNTKSVTPETYNKIMQAIDELGYIPRVAAQSLKTKKSLTIGVIVPEITNSFFTEIIRGVEDVAYENGYNIILCNTQEDKTREAAYLNHLFSRDIDGLIFVSTGKNESILNNNHRLPIVTVDRKVGKLDSAITVNNVKGGYIATKYLMAHYGNEVYMLTGPLSISTYFDRMTGYANAFKEIGIAYDLSMILQCEVSVTAGFETMKRLLKEKPEIKTVFASADIIAIGALKALAEGGKKVGEDVFLMGYDDIDMASMMIPSLTTIRQPKYEMGKSAAEILLNKIKNTAYKSKDVIFEPELVKRQTS